MLTVALTGGLASGKSTVGAMFVELGCYLVIADQLGHETLARGGAAYAPAVALFGEGILLTDGNIDRRALGAIVFANLEKLNQLTAIVHPAVEALRLERFAAIANVDPSAIILYEAAIHIETGLYRQFDRLILVTCDEELQLQRAMARSRWSREEAVARIRSQMPVEEKRKFAHYVIDTSLCEAGTRRQTEEIYNELRGVVSNTVSP